MGRAAVKPVALAHAVEHAGNPVDEFRQSCARHCRDGQGRITAFLEQRAQHGCLLTNLGNILMVKTTSIGRFASSRL